MDIKKIAIVGGGTAGWLAANHIGKALQHDKSVEVTLIESPDIPPIGVGEGTVPDIQTALKSFGISETEFIRTCEVTFKQSIKFVNWSDKAKHGCDNYYHHLFADSSPFGGDLTSHWLSGDQSKIYSDMVCPQHKVCEENKAPKTIITPEYQGQLGYAYHLNAAKFAELLASNAIEKFGVKHIKDKVIEVQLAPCGEITALQTKSNGRLGFDFYIDCTGFEGLLMEKALQVPFVSKAKELLVNKALVVQVPTQENEEIPPYTIATAHQAGWIWDIALTNRRGVGFVYSDQHMSDEQAKTKLDKYLGDKAEGLTYRMLPMRVGHSEKFWHKNCVVLGLAQGFLEPLEATSIMLTEFAAYHLAKRFPKSKADMPMLAKTFNEVMDYSWLRVVDFIKLHYCISDREDSEFWLDNKKTETIPETLQEKLTLWQKYTPQTDDFQSHYDVYSLTSYQYIMYGLHYPASDDFLADNSSVAKQQADKITQYTDNLLANLPQHRELINKIKRYGLQTN